jgi:hypothetical protein
MGASILLSRPQTRQKILWTAGVKLMKKQIFLLLKQKTPAFRPVLLMSFAKVQDFGKGF